MHAIAIPYRQGVLAKLEHFAEWLLLSFVDFAKKLPWAFALAFLITFGLGYTILAYFPLYYARLSYKALTDKVLAWIQDGSVEDRELMELHLEVETLNKKLSRITTLTKHFFVFRPLMDQFKKMYCDTQRLERGLFNHLYPEINDNLTAEQQKELVEAFKPWQELQ